jgi:hypothetical protein
MVDLTLFHICYGNVSKWLRNVKCSRVSSVLVAYCCTFLYFPSLASCCLSCTEADGRKHKPLIEFLNFGSNEPFPNVHKIVWWWRIYLGTLTIYSGLWLIMRYKSVKHYGQSEGRLCELLGSSGFRSRCWLFWVKLRKTVQNLKHFFAVVPSSIVFFLLLCLYLHLCNCTN